MTHKLLRLVCACLCAAACALSADAQESANPRSRTSDAVGRQSPSPAPSAPSASPAPSASSASSAEADEDFDLNIAERRITEEHYQASLSVALGGEAQRGLDLRVGVAVGAASIDVLLRNVRGRVRFRATLGQLLRLLDERRAGGTRHLDAPPAPSSP